MTDLTTLRGTDLARDLPGRISRPGDTGYATAVGLWARQDDVHPTAVVHCQTAEDVQAAIHMARERDLPLSVRGGGHDWAGRALCDGIVIDLSPMRHVILGSDRRSAIISGGARVGDVAAATDGHGVAAVTGSAACVGMAGLTLGGGYGPLIGRFGLALDNLLEAQIVLADGEIVCAGPSQNQDLFWALRGGGGNFGVVTAMRHRLHELSSVHAGLLIYPFSEAASVLERSAERAAAMPDEFSMQVGVAAGPDGAFGVLVAPTWSGAPEAGDAQLAAFSQLGTLLTGAVEQKSHAALLSTFDAFVINGWRVFADCCWLPALDSDGIGTLVAAMKNAPSPGCAIVTHDFRGAATRVTADATAFGLRREHVLVEILAMLPDSATARDEDTHRAWVHHSRAAFTGALPGGYPNMLGRNAADRAAVSYGPNAERLLRAKRRFDPDNVFSSAIPLPHPCR